ncbi:universal stress protein [Streptomyces sp. NPDC094468]|uniref:universal stress protein n=1 Tax=Streptomyces sp. NPDC094468 TaxID=3366066 RepID=UPI00380ECAD4
MQTRPVLPIVVGVDGSEPSLRAVGWAADEAVLRGLPLRLVHASLWERYEGTHPADDPDRPSEEIMAEAVVRTAARRARHRQPDVAVSTGVVAEEPEYALVRESRAAALVVTGTRGRSGLVEALLGSVSLALAGRAHYPVAVVRGSPEDRAAAPSPARIVVGVGEDPEESRAVRFACEEARRRGVPLDAVRAWRSPVYETTDLPRTSGELARLHEQEAAQALEAALRDVPPGIETHPRTVEGRARSVLAAASRDAALLVVGARRRPRTFGLHLGRVAHSVLHHSVCPVVVVPERE